MWVLLLLMHGVVRGDNCYKCPSGSCIVQGSFPGTVWGPFVSGQTPTCYYFDAQDIVRYLSPTIIPIGPPCPDPTTQCNCPTCCCRQFTQTSASSSGMTQTLWAPTYVPNTGFFCDNVTTACGSIVSAVTFPFDCSSGAQTACDGYPSCPGGCLCAGNNGVCTSCINAQMGVESLCQCAKGSAACNFACCRWGCNAAGTFCNFCTSPSAVCGNSCCPNGCDATGTSCASASSPPSTTETTTLPPATESPTCPSGCNCATVSCPQVTAVPVCSSCVDPTMDPSSQCKTKAQVLSDRCITEASIMLSADIYNAHATLTVCGAVFNICDSVTDGTNVAAWYVAFNTNPPIAVSVARGTVPTFASNWWQDAQFWRTDCSQQSSSNLQCSGLVHSGFYGVASKFVSRNRDLMNQFLQAAFRLVHTGHSLGAAAATLLAYDAHFQGITSSVITIGSPRVGDSQFATAYNAVMGPQKRFVDTATVSGWFYTCIAFPLGCTWTQSLVCEQDVVTTVPWGSYRHVDSAVVQCTTEFSSSFRSVVALKLHLSSWYVSIFQKGSDCPATGPCGSTYNPVTKKRQTARGANNVSFVDVSDDNLSYNAVVSHSSPLALRYFLGPSAMNFTQDMLATNAQVSVLRKISIETVISNVSASCEVVSELSVGDAVLFHGKDLAQHISVESETLAPFDFQVFLSDAVPNSGACVPVTTQVSVKVSQSVQYKATLTNTNATAVFAASVCLLALFAISFTVGVVCGACCRPSSCTNYSPLQQSVIFWCLGLVFLGIDAAGCILSVISAAKSSVYRPWATWLLVVLSFAECVSQLAIPAATIMDILCVEPQLFSSTQIIDCSATGPLQFANWNLPYYFLVFGLPFYYGSLILFGCVRLAVLQMFPPTETVNNSIEMIPKQ